MEKKEINELISKAKDENPQMATVLGLMDLTYNEGIDDCIHKIKTMYTPHQETADQIINSLNSLKK